MKRFIMKAAALAAAFAAGFTSVVPVLASDVRPLTEKLSEAGKNTLIGIVTVLLILFGLSLIISLFRFIPGAGGKKKEVPKAGTDDFVITSKKPAAAVAPEDNGEELAAVIMAAIAAYEGESFDPTKYRLRSVKRTGSSRRWNRAGRQL